MVTKLRLGLAPHLRTGNDGREQQDGHRAEQAVARDGLGQGTKLGTRGEGRAGEGPARLRRMGENEQLTRSVAAAVTTITAAATCIRATVVEGA